MLLFLTNKRENGEKNDKCTLEMEIPMSMIRVAEGIILRRNYIMCTSKK